MIDHQVTVSAITWGTVPEWLAAVGTVGAVCLSLAIAIREIRLRTASDEKRAKQQARFIRRDAEAFVAWMDVVPSGNSDPPKVLMRLSNTGDRPIFDILSEPVSLVSRHSGQKIVTALVGPNSEVVEDVTADLEALVGLNGIDPRHLLDPQGVFSVRSTYRDSSGYGWERSVSGLVFQIPHENVEILFRRPEDRDFSSRPWSRPPGWTPDAPDPTVGPPRD
jgi:hypothetical protein